MSNKFKLLPIRGRIFSGSLVIIMSEDMNHLLSKNLIFDTKTKNVWFFKLTINNNKTISLKCIQTNQYLNMQTNELTNNKSEIIYDCIDNLAVDKIYSGTKYNLFDTNLSYKLDTYIYFIPMNQSSYNIWNGKELVYLDKDVDIINMWKTKSKYDMGGICLTQKQGYLTEEDYGCIFTYRPEGLKNFFYNYCDGTKVCGSDCYGKCSQDINDNTPCEFNATTQNYPYMSNIEEQLQAEKRTYDRRPKRSYNWNILLTMIIIMLVVCIIILIFIYVKTLNDNQKSNRKYSKY